MMNQRALIGATIEPTKTNQWRIEGSHGTFRITLSDSGGWDITSDGRPSEHYAMLHHALIRSYNLSVGLAV